MADASYRYSVRDRVAAVRWLGIGRYGIVLVGLCVVVAGDGSARLNMLRNLDLDLDTTRHDEDDSGLAI